MNANPNLEQNPGYY